MFLTGDTTAKTAVGRKGPTSIMLAQSKKAVIVILTQDGANPGNITSYALPLIVIVLSLSLLSLQPYCCVNALFRARFKILLGTPSSKPTSSRRTSKSHSFSLFPSPNILWGDKHTVRVCFHNKLLVVSRFSLLIKLFLTVSCCREKESWVFELMKTRAAKKNEFQKPFEFTSGEKGKRKNF